jgi:KaiC/GvpD/RAD55 family RecA-like ATPase
VLRDSPQLDELNALAQLNGLQLNEARWQVRVWGCWCAHTKPITADEPVHLKLVVVVPSIPLIEDLTKSPVHVGTILLVEFTGSSSSLWYNAASTIAAGWLKQGGKVSYNALAQSPDDVRSALTRLGVDCETSEKEDKLRIWDFYTASLGKRSSEKYAYDSLKAMDLSLRVAKEDMQEAPQPEWLRVVENSSTWYRFNDEKAMMEVEMTRFIPSFRLRKSTAIRGMLKSVHSNWVYEQLESAHDGIIDFRLDETSDPPQNLMRIRSLRNLHFDGRWHVLKVTENFEITLEK